MNGSNGNNGDPGSTVVPSNDTNIQDAGGLHIHFALKG